MLAGDRARDIVSGTTSAQRGWPCPGEAIVPPLTLPRHDAAQAGRRHAMPEEETMVDLQETPL